MGGLESECKVGVAEDELIHSNRDRRSEPSKGLTETMGDYRDRSKGKEMKERDRAKGDRKRRARERREEKRGREESQRRWIRVLEGSFRSRLIRARRYVCERVQCHR